MGAGRLSRRQELEVGREDKAAHSLWKGELRGCALCPSPPTQQKTRSNPACHSSLRARPLLQAPLTLIVISIHMASRSKHVFVDKMLNNVEIMEMFNCDWLETFLSFPNLKRKGGKFLFYKKKN